MMGMAGFAVALMMIAVIISPSVYGKEFPDHHEIKVQRLLKRLNKPAVKSIKSEDGDIIDCVPIASQPALDHPLLRNHTIQLRPRFVPEGESKYAKKKVKTVTQVWHKNGECPGSTVPIRRTKKEDILRPNSVESFKKRTHQSNPEGPSGDHEYAVMESEAGNFYGTQFTVNIWNPNVEAGSDEFSLAQTWLVSGDDQSRLNTIEAGWQVYPNKYRDNNVRLFVFWTRDGYYTTRCYNLDCNGPSFVQMSNTITVGGSLARVSQYDGEQEELSMLIWKDGENWWLKIGEELVGYWPGTLFTTLARKRSYKSSMGW